MKKVITLLLLTIPIFAIAQRQFLIRGEIKNIQAPVKVYLLYRYDTPGARTHWDSTIVKNGKFEFRGDVTDTVTATIMVDYKGVNLDGIWKKNNVDELNIYLTNDTTFLTGDDSVRNAKLSGSKINADYYRYKVLVNSTTSDSETTALTETFIKENPGSYISLIEGLKNSNFSIGETEMLFGSLSISVRSSKIGVEFKKNLNALKATTIGSIAPNFVLPDTNGKSIKLSSFRGKYVLLDFWASWCGPCRMNNPRLVKLFSTFKAKNFAILGVSLDGPGKRADWLKAIKDDHLTWCQVSDIRSWEYSEVAKLYAIQGIPQTLLIDPNGKIIGRNLFGDELEKKLAEIFGKI